MIHRARRQQKTRQEEAAQKAGQEEAAQKTREEEAKQQLYRHHYEQVCHSLQRIDDFRGKLLALWPILGGAAGGIALLASDKLRTEYLLPLGIFGVLVSVGVGMYEWTQTLRCAQLKDVARQLEWDMKLEKGQGQFITIYDRYKAHLKGTPEGDGIVGIGIASAIVYSSVVIGWLYIALLGLLGLFTK
jgi:hypothetical protein